MSTRAFQCQRTNHWVQYGSKGNQDMTLDSRKVEHLEKKQTQRVQGSIGLNHLSYEFQINTWQICGFAGISVPTA